MSKTYNSLQSDFLRLPDNDINGAYRLMIESSGLIKEKDTEINQKKKLLAIMEIKIKSIESRLSHKHSPKSVANGERFVNFDRRVKKIRIAYVEAMEELENLIAEKKDLERINFITQKIYDNSLREYRTTKG